MYEYLNFSRILKTLILLNKRISERFPESSLRDISDDLIALAKESNHNINWIKKPNYWLRAGLIVLITSTGLLLLLSIQEVKIDYQNWGFEEFIPINVVASISPT